MRAIVVLTALLATTVWSLAYDRELAEAHRCFVDRATRYAPVCDSIDALSGAVMGACDKEYRATIKAFSESPVASNLTDADKLRLGKMLFENARDRIRYFLVEERLNQSVCLDRR